MGLKEEMSKSQEFPSANHIMLIRLFLKKKICLQFELFSGSWGLGSGSGVSFHPCDAAATCSLAVCFPTGFCSGLSMGQ